jgi:hypothetical protein
MSIEQDVGKLQGQMEKVQGDITSLSHKFDKFEESQAVFYKEVTDLISQTKGGWKVMVSLVGVVTFISSGVHWVLSNIKVGFGQ